MEYHKKPPVNFAHILICYCNSIFLTVNWIVAVVAATIRNAQNEHFN